MKRRALLLGCCAIPLLGYSATPLRLASPEISSWSSDTRVMVLTDGTRMQMVRIMWEQRFMAYGYGVEFRRDGRVYHTYISYHEPGDVPDGYSLLWAAYRAVYGEPV